MNVRLPFSLKVARSPVFQLPGSPHGRTTSMPQLHHAVLSIVATDAGEVGVSAKYQLGVALRGARSSGTVPAGLLQVTFSAPSSSSSSPSSCCFSCKRPVRDETSTIAFGSPWRRRSSQKRPWLRRSPVILTANNQHRLFADVDEQID